MAHSRRASALLRRALRVEFAARSAAGGARGLASLTVDPCDRTGSSRSSEGPGWRARAAVMGGVAAVTGFMSLLQLQQPVAARSESIQQLEAPVATEPIDAR